MPLLRNLCPEFIPESVVDELKKINVSSVEALLSMEDKEILAKTKITEEALQLIKTNVIAQYCSNGIRGSDLVTHSINQSVILRTGCDSIDNILNGGLFTGQITELVGQTASGKTQICMNCALTVSALLGHTVLYIDTTNSFDALRLDQILKSRKRLQPEFKDRTTSDVLSKIRCVKCFNVFQILDILDNTIQQIESDSSPFHSALRLIIVDSIGSLIAPILGGLKNPTGHVLMIQVARTLKTIATSYEIGVLVTNYTVSSGAGFKAALGESWTYVPNTQITLYADQVKAKKKQASGSSMVIVRRAELTKSPIQPSGLIVNFEINDNGVTSVQQ